MQRDYLVRAEIINRLKISESTLSRMLRVGEGPPCWMIGRQLRWPRDLLEGYQKGDRTIQGEQRVPYGRVLLDHDIHGGINDAAEAWGHNEGRRRFDLLLSKGGDSADELARYALETRLFDPNGEFGAIWPVHVRDNDSELRRYILTLCDQTRLFFEPDESNGWEGWLIKAMFIEARSMHKRETQWRRGEVADNPYRSM